MPTPLALAAPVDDPRLRDEILADGALAFLAALHDEFAGRQRALVARRRDRPPLTGPLAATEDVRRDSWQVAPPAADYRDRRVEITGPTDRKMVINALNSGARGFMADFEDATTPAWTTLLEGQANLVDAVAGTVAWDDPDGRSYRLGRSPATLLVRPRGLHLPERHLRRGEHPASGALTDAGLFLYHNAQRLVAQGRSVHVYLPKLEDHAEAAWWDAVLGGAEAQLGLAAGTVRTTVLIETLPAALQMHEILFALRGRAHGLNAGRWDYIFSAIKCLPRGAGVILPDRAQITMDVPFLRRYAELLVATCHARGTFAMGGMAALVPARDDADATARALAAVRADKRREARAGFDGTWVAHPAVVPVAAQEFDAVLGERPHQIDAPAAAAPPAAALLDVAATPGTVTEGGVRESLSVAFRYLTSWFAGRGAVALDGAMEDAATAEICRALVWHWIDAGARLSDGRPVTRALVARMLDEEVTAAGGTGTPPAAQARALLERLVLGDELADFFTLAAYATLTDGACAPGQSPPANPGARPIAGGRPAA